MSPGSIFNAEEEILSGMAQLLEASGVGEPELRNGLATLLEAYKRLYKDEKHLIRVNDRQQNQMNRLNRELKIAKDVAEAASRSKGDFLANMSHEIRTPMNAVIGLTELSLRTNLTNQQYDYLTKIESSANSLLGIINDILDFSKIEVGKLTLEHIDFDLNEVLENLTSLIAVNAGEKGLELLFNIAPEVPTALRGDPLRLGQILINLTSNAVKFTEKGEILVRVESCESPLSEPERVKLKFSIQDTGIGMSQTQMEGLFESFSQADQSTTRKYGGTGLGLNISKRLTEMMGGRIGVESETGKGSTFWFTACFNVQTTTIKEPNTRLVDSAEGLKVLVVDDNPKSREIMDTMLSSHALVFQAASADEAFSDLLNADRDVSFDIVLMDWKMPGMDGLEAINHIRSELGLSRQPVIFLVTAYGRSEIRQKAQKVDIDGFLIKPVTSTLLFSKINSVFDTSPANGPIHITPKSFDDEIPDEIKGARILLVEDNEINQQVACELLSQSGLSVFTANSEREAVAMVQEQTFDLVFMDVQMPDMDGYQATQMIRELEGLSMGSENISPFTVFPGPQLPIVAMTANAMVGDRQKCLSAGMNDYMTKPINPRVLSKIIMEWVQPGNREVIPKAEEARPETDADLPDTLTGIDIRAGLKIVGNNRSVFKKIILQFYHHNQTTISDIKTALDASDTKEAARCAHTIKGVSGNIGAGEIYKAAAGLEHSLLKGDFDQVPSLMDLLSQNLGETLEALAPLAEQERGAGKAVPETPVGEVTEEKKGQIGVLLQNLIIQVGEDVTKASQTLKELSGLMGRTQEIDRIAAAFDEYDWDDMQDHIRHLAAHLGLTMDISE